MSPGTEIILVFVKMSILAKVSTLAILSQKIRYSKKFKDREKILSWHHLSKIDVCTMIITPRCLTSFFILLWLKKKINSEKRILFVLLTLQMSGLFSYKLGLAALLTTALISLATVVFIIIEKTNQMAAL